MKSQMIARLSVTMEDVKPKVTRELDVPADIRLDRLHAVLQEAIGWTDSHLYEIRAGDTGWGIPDPDWGDGPLDAGKATLWDVVEGTGTKTLRYLYDFGDGWEHVLKVERLFPAEPGVLYPVLVEATGCCPPEDVGGPFGYAEYVAAVTNPKDKRHREMKEWFDMGTDPAVAPVDRLTAAVAALAKKWNKTPRRTKS